MLPHIYLCTVTNKDELFREAGSFQTEVDKASTGIITFIT